MVRPLAVRQAVGRRWLALPLESLLQPGLGVFRRRAREGHGRQFVNHIHADKLAGCFHSLVEIDGSNHGLHCCGQYRILVASAGGFHPAPDQQPLAQSPAPGHLGQRLAAHQPRTGLGQLPLVGIRELAVQVRGDRQLQHCVAQKFKALVRLRGVQPVLIAVGAMHQGATEKAGVPEPEPQQRCRVRIVAVGGLKRPHEATAAVGA